MIILDSTTKSITVAMSGAAATTNPDFVAAWADNTSTSFTEGATDGTLNGTTQVTLVAAPAASTQRAVKTITIENKDTAPVTIIVTYNNNGTLRTIAKTTLQVGDTWSTDGVTDTNGNFKNIGASGYSGFSGYSGSGISGFSGFSGYSGYSGIGISGYSGFSGSGISGYSGYSGYSGSGISGYSGSGISGYSGFSGFSGISGYSGAQGPTTYPAAGIAVSTGSAWGTSYTTSGSGTVVALATSPSFTTPVLGTPTSGNLSNCTADGTNAVGFLGIPQNSQSAAYTTVLSDAGKQIFHPSSDANARTFTIAANSSVAYPIGTVIQFVNMSANNVTIAINTDTLTWAQGGGTGSRTLAQYGVANCLKIASTQWLLTGTNVT